MVALKLRKYRREFPHAVGTTKTTSLPKSYVVNFAFSH